jgi:hypothetical protein
MVARIWRSLRNRKIQQLNRNLLDYLAIHALGQVNLAHAAPTEKRGQLVRPASDASRLSRRYH